MEAIASAIDFSPSSPAYLMALNLIVIGLVLSAFALGISRVLGSRKLWSWGVEELAQSLINAALVGAIVGFGTLAATTMGSLADSSDFSNCAHFEKAQNSPIAYSLCSIEDLQQKSWDILDGANEQAFSLGVLSSIELSFSVVRASPFSSLSNSAQNYSQWAQNISFILSALEINRQFLFFIAQSAFSLFLPIGLLLRMFFATRKLGGALMAGAIGFFMVYPLLYSAFVSGNSSISEPYKQAFSDLDLLSQTVSFAPAIDWGKEPNMSLVFSSLQGKQLMEKVSIPYKSVSEFIGAASAYAILYTIICFLLTLVCVKELSSLLGSEFRLDLFEKV